MPETMTLPETGALAAFRQFLDEQIESEAGAGMSPETALALWRERQATIRAVLAGVREVDAGLSIPADEALRRIRGDARVQTGCST